MSYNNDKCQHRKFKMNYPFGRASGPSFKCKLCGKALGRRELPKYQRMKDAQRAFRGRSR